MTAQITSITQRFMPGRGKELTAVAADPVYHGADDPAQDVRWGKAVAIFFFVIFVGWASFARLDAAAQAPGRLVVAGQRQAVQHRDGGVVGEIMVKEGARVRQGQVLIRLAAAEVRAQERALSSQAITLLAQRARLQAEQQGRGSITPPPEFSELSSRDKAEAQEALRIQESQRRTRAAVLSAQSSVLGQRTAQAGSQGQGYSRQVVATQEQLRLITEELEALRTVAEKGFVSKSRIRALERAKAELEGQSGQYSATVASSRGQVSETRLQVLEARSNYLDKVATELRDVETSLNEILPKLNAARDQLARTEIRSPATGTVVGLTVFTPGGVIAAGEKLMDVVPEKAGLSIEARISPADADDLRVGQEAFVRFDTLHERSLPNLTGIVTRFSADSFTDERTGESFFTADVAVPPSEIDKIAKVRGEDFELRAGMPVSIQIPLRKRTALQYALEPLTQALWGSFREQ